MAKLLIVDDAPLIADRIALALTPLGHECIWAADGLEATQAYSKERPDAVFLDIAMPVMDGISALQAIREADPRARVTMVSAVPYPARVEEAWSAGARGLLSRESGPARVRAALNAVNQGLVAVDPALGGALLPTHGATDAFKVEELTKREHEVLKLLAEGLSNRSIAVQLEISEHTVKYHVNSILRKLGAQSRTEAVVRATRSGLILL